ncbi:transposase [Sphingobium sp.]|uniref:transposase n=2 Tax=Sphingobium TaxID=165695 RepID=UPI00257E6199|nr:transposase [Sphingobium sp.]
MDRGDLSDAEWDLIGPLLPPERGRHARPAGDNRRYLNGMLHVLRVGCPWRDMHERYGKWNSVYVRFRRWAEQGVWDAMLQRDCQDFRVWPGIMGNKESHYVTTQRTCHTE